VKMAVVHMTDRQCNDAVILLGWMMNHV